MGYWAVLGGRGFGLGSFMWLMMINSLGARSKMGVWVGGRFLLRLVIWVVKGC